MVFTSPSFLFFFLPITLLLNFIFQKYKVKNLVLLILSLFFYVFGEGELVLLMFGSITFNYFLGKWIEKKKSKKSIIIGVAANLILLIIYKYTNFIIDNINYIFKAFEVRLIDDVNIKLPVGISFYTFQSISYLIDVYRNNNKAQKSFVDLGLYISLFPQLIAGPIVRYKDIANQLKNRVLYFDDFAYGVKRFIIGFCKKVLIANTLAVTSDIIFDLDIYLLDSSTAWLGIIFFTLQVYFDFSGYSDMAIGLGYMLGFKFMENFNFPYISKSVKELWTRWHISLSIWFRDYLYIPLGGSRKGSIRTYFNLFMVFFLTGLWHGASWNFIVWGVIHGIFMIIEKLGFDKILKKIGFFQHIYTLLVFIVALTIFRNDTLKEGYDYITMMFTNMHSDVHYSANMFLSKENIIVASFAVIMSFNGLNLLGNKIMSVASSNLVITNILLNIRAFGLLLVFIYSIMSITAGSYNPFIYFRF
jgi:alginate O-acetyltransferase complex protein AlgI